MFGKIIVTLFVVLTCCSCKEQQVKIVDVRSNFSTKIQLSSPQNFISDILEPTQIVICDSLLFISDRHNSSMINVYDLNGNHITETLYKGRGPGESSNILRIFANNHHLYASVADGNIYCYHLDDIRNNKRLPDRVLSLPDNLYSFPSISVANNQLLFVGRNNDLSNICQTRFCCYNIDKQILQEFGEFPLTDKSLYSYPQNDYSKYTAYQGHIHPSPDGNKAVVIYFYAVGLDIININQKEIKTSVFYQYPEVELVNIGDTAVKTVKRKEKSKRGFLDVWCNNEYIYVLYSDKQFNQEYNQGCYILKYDWDGNPICEIELDREALCISIDQHNRYLYVVTPTDTGSDIVRYELNNEML